VGGPGPAASAASRYRALGATGGFALSFIGMGLLWIGLPWVCQALMFFPFLLLAYALAKAGGVATAMSVLYGALPLAMLLMMFRDRDDSHLMPMLIVAAWLAGILGGRALAAMGRRGARNATE
jgi:hypothetical protein